METESGAVLLRPIISTTHSLAEIFTGLSNRPEKMEKVEMTDQIDTADHILELERMNSRLLASGDVDKMMEYMAEDVKLLNPGAELLVGNHHEKEGLEAARDTEGLDMSFEPTGAEISSSGDMAFAYGEISMKLPDGSQQTEKYVTIWRKRHGKWQVVLQARNANE